MYTDHDFDEDVSFVSLKKWQGHISAISEMVSGV